MTELGILLAAVCLLAVLIDWRRPYEVTGHFWFSQGGRSFFGSTIECLGRRYRLVGRGSFTRDTVLIRRCLRG